MSVFMFGSINIAIKRITMLCCFYRRPPLYKWERSQRRHLRNVLTSLPTIDHLKYWTWWKASKNSKSRDCVDASYQTHLYRHLQYKRCANACNVLTSKSKQKLKFRSSSLFILDPVQQIELELFWLFSRDPTRAGKLICWSRVVLYFNEWQVITV